MSAFLIKNMTRIPMTMSDRKKPNAARCLFGALDDNDRATIQKGLDQQEKLIDDLETQRFINRWQFDPVKGVPLVTEDPKFEYELLDNKSIPAIYSSVYKHRPSRPVSMHRVRSPISVRKTLSSSVSRPAKRKLRFGIDSDDSNDENCEILSEVIASQPKQARVDIMDISSSTHTTNSDICPSPVSPQASSLREQASCPSPLVLSSSCPPVFESEAVQERLQCSFSGLTRSASESSFEDIFAVSPSIHAMDYITPCVRVHKAKLVQRVITDYGSIKKRKSGKPSPRS